jgi:acyl-coenzyme A synthetase/AMP-(fatty) acid ligase
VWVWFLGEDGVVEELPKTASGKIQKNILREWSRELAPQGIGKVGDNVQA